MEYTSYWFASLNEAKAFRSVSETGVGWAGSVTLRKVGGELWRVTVREGHYSL